MPVGYRACSTSFAPSVPFRRVLWACHPSKGDVQGRRGVDCPLCCSSVAMSARRWTPLSGKKLRVVRLEATRMIVSTMMTGVTVKEEVELGEEDLVVGQPGDFDETFWEMDFAENKAAKMDELVGLLSKAAVELKKSRGGGGVGGFRPGGGGGGGGRGGRARVGARKYLRPRHTPQKTIHIARKLDFAVNSIQEDDEEIMTSKVVGRKPVEEASAAEQKQLKLLKKKKKFVGKKLNDSRIVPLLEATRSPLLTPEEEIKLGTVVQRGMRLEKANEKLEKKLGRKPSTWECAENANMTVSTYKKVLQAAKVARKTFVTRNMRLVVSVAKKYHLSDGDLADLVSDGLTGLNRAIDKFDPTLGFRFSTYAHWWIRQAAVRGQSDQSRVIRVPSHIYELISKVRKCEGLLNEQGKEVDDVAIGEILGTSTSKIRKARNAVKRNVNLDNPVRDSNHSMHDIIEDPKGNRGDVESMHHSLRLDLENVLDTLYPRERNVLRLRYGLDDGRERTLVEIGEFLSITRERVRQIEVKAVRKLRTPDRSGNLLDYRGEESEPVRPPGRVPGYARKSS